ncbi:hypothetical protein CVT26_001875 [Gymnopilus dilepis]|uniref:Uncharacterized protein n=1 Tax=Gymnopilus dilepis TaxID=231916 RepID=A0A409Y3X6_9AGAR|nr:hypothetical protein CVT26_001875 [Gymnopilus dilepis]
MSLPKYVPVLPTVTEQPMVDSKEMVIEESGPVSHHERCRCHHDDELMYSSHGHRRCHNARLKRYLLPALAVLLLLCGLMAMTCMSGYESLIGELGSSAGESLFSRQVGAGASNGSGSAFTHRKLYLIVIFVGLFLVLVLAVMLSAWCCRGAFENPLCCPCYLCACCGGLGESPLLPFLMLSNCANDQFFALACLDCIACGLCADAAEQM